MNKKTWNDIVKPIVVLLVICVVCSAALAGANELTAPIIAAQQAGAANAAYLEVLPEADGFEEITEFSTTNVQKVLKATNGAGWVIEASAKGFGGDVPAVVGFDASGAIVGLKFLENTETAGYGQKLVDGSADGTAFIAQFIGLSGTLELGSGVDAIAGVTVSSKAALNAVNTATNCFNEVALGEEAVVEEEIPEMTLDEAIVDLAGGEVTAIDTPEGLDAAYTSGTITVLVSSDTGYTADGYGDPKPLTVAVAFDEGGTIVGIWVDATKQTQGIGDVVAEPEFKDKFLGIQNEDGLADVDAIAGVTESCVGVKKAVRRCVQHMATLTGGEGAGSDESAVSASTPADSTSAAAAA